MSESKVIDYFKKITDNDQQIVGGMAAHIEMLEAKLKTVSEGGSVLINTTTQGMLYCIGVPIDTNNN